MNKLEANISLFAITFFSAVQYIFLAGIPAELSHFAFLSVTNFAGFLMTLAFFFGELFRLDLKQVFQSAVLSGELIGFNVFMLMGVKGIDPAVSSAVLSSYFLFILIFEAFLYHKKPDRNQIFSVIFVLLGLFLMMNADVKSLFNVNILYFVIADMFFAIYVITVGSYAASSNPSVLAMGQMFFCCIFSSFLWIGESFFKGIPLALPVNKEFWSGVVYTGFFIRGLYGIVQIYAQRYVSPLNTSLIFASEIVMTMFIAPLLSSMLDTSADDITQLKIFGSALIIFGLVIMEPEFVKFFAKIEKIKKFRIPEKNNSLFIDTRQKIFVISISALVYVLMDISVRVTDFLPHYLGIKNSLPFITGLFFGLYGTLGNLIGCVVSSLLAGGTTDEIFWECWCVFIIGICMYYSWHLLSKSHRIHFKHLRHYVRYILLAALASALCLRFKYAASYFITGILIGLPTDILFGSLLYVEPFVPVWCKNSNDVDLSLEAGGESLENANEILQDTASKKGISLKRVFELQSCLEELSIRIFKAVPDAKIKVGIIYYDAISIRLDYICKKYNPFKINKGEDILDIMSLKIIKHRALRASFVFYKGENKIHVVI